MSTSDRGPERVSTLALLTDALSQIATLVQTEFQLAKTEIGEKIDQVVQSVIMIAVAAIVALAGLIVALLAIAAWLARAGLPLHWAFTAVAAGVLVIAAILIAVGLSNLKASRLMPERTLRQVNRDASVVKDQL